MPSSLLHRQFQSQGDFLADNASIPHRIPHQILKKWSKIDHVMRDGHINTAPTELGPVNWGSVGTASAGPQAGAAGPSDFALTLRRDGNETAVLVLAGELDLYRAPAINDALEEAIGANLDSNWLRQPSIGPPPSEGAQGPDGKVRHLTVDLRLVTFIDSATSHLLVAASRHQHAQGGQLQVLVGPQTPMIAFEVLGFDRLLAIKRLHDEARSSDICTVSSERIGLSPPPIGPPKERNHHGNNGNN
jgi:anti-anti-sigma regulatory factor